MVDRYTKEKNNGFFSGGIWLQSFCFWLFLFYSDKLVFVLLSCLVAQLIDICSWNFHVGEEQLCRTRIHTGTQKPLEVCLNMPKQNATIDFFSPFLPMQ